VISEIVEAQGKSTESKMTEVKHVQENLTIPLVHLNGTSKKELLKQLEDAYRAVAEAGRMLAQATPHDRDYYVLGPDVGHKAREEHHARMRKLADIEHDLTDIAIGIDRQGNRT
jgi:hypothetical protein